MRRHPHSHGHLQHCYTWFLLMTAQRPPAMYPTARLYPHLCLDQLHRRFAHPTAAHATHALGK
jgi:hypothetical protein